MYFIAQTEIAQITRLSQAGRLSPFSFWQTSLTLSQPGGQIMPTTVLKAPPPGFLDLATVLSHRKFFISLFKITA